MLCNLFLNESWLDCIENLEVGNLDPLIQILQVTYYENNSHSLQSTEWHNLSNCYFIQTKTHVILQSTPSSNPHIGPSKLH